MEAAASTIGLLAVGAKVYSALKILIASAYEAPLVVHSLCDEVRDFRFVLAKLQPYVDGSSSITLLGASKTDVDQLSLTLATSVITFSRLEKKLDHVLGQQGPMTTLDRLRWSFAESDITQLVNRLQQHKSTMTLLLTIWISESLTEAEKCTEQLDNQLAAAIYQMPEAGTWGQSAMTLGSLTAIPETDSSSIMTVNHHFMFNHHSFESTLFASRPYRRSASPSGISLASSKRPGMRWSLLSGGSNDSVFSLPISPIESNEFRQTLAEISNIPGIPLPLSNDDIYNPWWYCAGGTVSPASFKDCPLVLPLTSRPQNLDLEYLRAASKGNPIAALGALAMGANIEARGEFGDTGLTCAVRGNQRNMVQTLLDEGADIEGMDNFRNTALHTAAIADRQAICALLLDRGADTEAKNKAQETPLEIAVTRGYQAIVRQLLDGGADIKSKNMAGMTPLLVALAHGQAAIVEHLLDRGADLEAKDDDQNTPLHIAVGNGDNSIVKKLLDRGAKIEEQNCDGFTPLQHAVINNRQTIVALLLDRGADIETIDKSHNTPLHYAALRDLIVISEQLLARGADIEAVNQFGNTPLHRATYYGSRKIVAQLLKRGADREAREKEGKSIFDLARGQAMPDQLLSQ